MLLEYNDFEVFFEGFFNSEVEGILLDVFIINYIFNNYFKYLDILE